MGETRKTVLFIVEGPSDKTALEKIFKKIYRYERGIEFRFTDGDVSSDPETTITTVENKIYSIVDAFIKDKKLKKSDIFQVIQIFDMDGAYIPDTAISYGNSGAFAYSLTGISCNDPQKVKDRNMQKRKIMDHLLSLHEIKGLAYEMYYMSCNLDHALYNEMNLSKDKKQSYADAFYERFLGNEDKFIGFLQTDVVNGVPNSFIASWRYIKEDLHSVERCICLLQADRLSFLQQSRPLEIHLRVQR